MKNCFYRCVLFVLVATPFKARAIEVFVQPGVFYKSTFEPYLDLQVFIHHHGLTRHYSTDSLVWLETNLTMVLKQKDRILQAGKWLVKSPPSKSPRPFFHSVLWDVEPGVYHLETHVQDPDHPGQEITLLDSLVVEPIHGFYGISQLRLLQHAKSSVDSTNPLYRNGIYAEPLLYETFEHDQHVLFAYFETYAKPGLETGLAIRFLLHTMDSSGGTHLHQQWYKKRKSVLIEPHLLQHDISELSSGQYKLTVQIVDQNQSVLDETLVQFYRKNPFWDKISYWYSSRKEDKLFFDTMAIERVDYAIRAVHPLIDGLNVPILNEMLKNRKEAEKRLFLFSYFSEQADTARVAYHKYMKVANFLNEEFKSGFGYGFETDRGIIFLRYGKPDEVIKEDKDSGAFPYEIWKYNKVAKAGQTNVKFLFYNPDLAGSDFRLLHSNAIGERHNRKWEIELYKNAPFEFKGDNPIDATQMQSNINRRAREYFDN